MSATPAVTICVPVYNGRRFVAETLTALQRQQYEPFTVLISDDASDDGSADACRRFLADARFRLEIQPARLGWVENCNWLLRHASGSLVCLVSHDDVPEPEFIARLVHGLSARPDAALAFSDIRVFGLLDHVEHQASIGGSTAERVRAFMASHFDGTAFHALIRRPALALAGGLRGNAMDHFAADVAWLGRLARAGAFVRVPEPLYRKRRHPGSVSMQWDWAPDVRADAWAVHCRELLADALRASTTPVEARAMIRAAVRRLLAIEPERPFPFIRGFSPARRAALVRTMLRGLEVAGERRPQYR